MKSTRVYLATGVLLVGSALVMAGCASAVPTAVPPTVAPPPTSAPVATAAPAATTAPAAAPTSAPASGATSAPAAAAPIAKAVTLMMGKNDELGSFITDGDGNTLYMFTHDVKGTSNCYDKCAEAWPAVIPQGQPTLKDGVAASLVSTTARKDGSMQLTYNGWPLYYYAKDTKPGDTTGQAVGKVWWVVSGEGNIIRPASLTVATDPKLGKILADGDGNTLYAFTKDTKDTSNCYDKCEVAWPPMLSVGTQTLGDGVQASLWGTTTRKDGSVQVTYNGIPLYYYVKDMKPGDVTGQNVGTVWFVVAPDGTIVKTAP